MRFISLVVLLIALSVCESGAQVYIGSNGPEWNGACDNSCPQSAPCRLQARNARTDVSWTCTIIFMNGTVLPYHTFSLIYGGSLTFSSLGPISAPSRVSMQVEILNPSTQVSLRNFILSGSSTLEIYGYRVSIIDSSLTIMDNSQIIFSYGTLVNIQNSNFSSNLPPLKGNSLKSEAAVDISGSNFQNAKGIFETANCVVPINIRDSTINGSMFPTAQLSNVLVENTLATLVNTARVFGSVPTGTVSFLNSRIWSNVASGLTDSTSSSIGTLKIIGSHFRNVTACAKADVIEFQSSNFTVDDLYDPIINVTDVGTATLSDLTITTLKTSGSASALTSFMSYPDGMGSWSISNIIFSSELSVPRMRIGGSSMTLSASFQFPSLEIVGSSMTLATPEGLNLSFTGDITTSTGTSTLSFTNASVFFHSISIGNGVTVTCGDCDQFAYDATDLDHGIQCLDAVDCLDVNSVVIRWPYDLPVVGSTYFFSNSTKNTLAFNSSNNEFIITSVSLNSQMNFSFQEVTCPAHSQCTPAPDSSHCVSRYQCTCDPGYVNQGFACELVPPPTEIPVSAPPVSDNSPVSDTPPVSGTPQTIDPPGTPSQAPTSVPATTPTSNIPSPTSVDSPTSSSHQQMSMWYISVGIASVVLLWL